MKKYFISAALFVSIFIAAVIGYKYLSAHYTEEVIPVSDVSGTTATVSEKTDILTVSADTIKQPAEEKQQEKTPELTEVKAEETSSYTTGFVPETTETEPVRLELQTEDFTVYDQNGDPVNLSDFLGKPIVVNFWSTWCGSCVDELPLFDSLYAKYGEQAAFLMINVPMSGDEKADTFIEENGYSFPVYYDSEFNAADTYGVWAMPQSLFINKEGELVQSYNGELTESKLLSYFESIK